MTFKSTFTFGTIAALATLASPPLARAQSVRRPHESAYFSLIKKGTATRFYNRLTSPDYHFVAAAAPVAGAVRSQRLDARPGERLVLVELQPKAGVMPGPLAGELARFASFAVLSQPKRADLHLLQGNALLYGEPLGTVEHAVAPTKKPAGLATVHLSAAASRVTVPQEFLETRVRQLSGDLPVNVGGREVTLTDRSTDEHKSLAREWLKQEYEELGYTVNIKEYQGQSFGTNANVTAERLGSDPSRVLIVSSHLDSFGNAGADDNAAGTISALAVAQALRNLPLRYTLRFVAFDEEEVGMIGSAAYAQQLQDSGELDGVLGVINMEMTGYNAAGDGAFHIIDCQENTSAQLSRRFRDVAKRDRALGLKFVAACTSRSDHASFWRFDKPAVVFSQNFFGGDGNPCYHQACDKADIMNFNYMARMTTLLARVTQELIGG